MAGTLLIIGITLFVVGTLVLVQDATSRSRNWLVVVLPFTGMSYCRHHWEDVRIAVLLRVFGGLTLLFGLGVLLAEHPQVLQNRKLVVFDNTGAELRGSKLANVDNYANSATAMLVELHKKDASGLVGEVAGGPFNADRVQLTQGVLSIEQGEGFLPEKEVRIIVGLDASYITSRQDIFVRPGDDQVPEVQISQLEPGQSFPTTRVIRSGYSMELQLAPLDKQQLKGYIQLVIPGRDEYLVGEFVAYTNNLRYRNGRVDLTYNDPDTLEYVAGQYLSTQYQASQISKIEYRDTSMRLSRNAGNTIARIYLNNGQIEDRLLELERADIGWALRPGGVETRIVQVGALTALPAESAEQAQAEAAKPPPLETTFADLASQAGSMLVVIKKNGETRTGKLLGVRRTLLQLEAKVGNGMVQFSIDASEIESLRFASGQKIILTDGAAAAEANIAAPAASAATSEPSPASEPAPAEPPAPPPVNHRVGAGGAMQPYLAYKGKTVTLTDSTGKSRTGQVLDVTDRELKLGVRLGSGMLEYFYSADEIASIKEAAP